MSRSKSFFFAAIIFGLCCASAAPAQTVASVSVISGSGQLACPGCPVGGIRNFEPMVVKVADAAGRPVEGATVTWAATGGAGLLSLQTTTDAAGLTQNSIPIGGVLEIPGSFYQPFTVTATYGSASATMVATAVTNLYFAFASLIAPDTSATFSGVAGSQSPTKIQVHVANAFSAIPNVSVRLVNFDAASPAVSCVTAPGADPGSVLTDANGDATCTVLFGTSIGADQLFTALVGGVNSSIGINNFDRVGKPVGYSALGNFLATVTPAIPGKITILGGNGQTANQGASLLLPLRAVVTDAAGTANISGQSVTWTVTPANAAILGSATTTSDTSGNVSNTVTFTNFAAGAVQIKAALTSNPSISAIFPETAIVVIVLSSFDKVSGEPQSAAVNTVFANPLVVKATGSNGLPLVNVPVQFAVTGGQAAFTTAASTVTDTNGQASVKVLAGLTEGALTITATATATAANVTRTFNLTVTPEAPQITASSFTNGAQAYTSYDNNHSALSPCGIALLGNGFTPSTPGLSAIKLGPLASSLSNVSIAFGNSQAPIYSIATVGGAQQVTFQVPCDVTPGNSVPVRVTVNGGSTTTNVIVRAAGPGIFESGANQSDNTARAVLLKPDGTFMSDTNPARKGDVVRVFATGLGATLPAVSGTNALPPIGVDALVRGLVIPAVNNSGVRLIQARLSPDLAGVYEVDFQVPTDAPAGSNVVLSLAVNAPDGTPTQFSLYSKIAIQ